MKRILIVDDNEKNRKLMRVMLSKSGYEVLEAENGQAGLDIVREIHPDLVLMDYRMPVMDGIQATKAIKYENATSKIPVFIVTSSAMAGDSQRICAESSCDRFFTKPIDFKELLDIVKKEIGV